MQMEDVYEITYDTCGQYWPKIHHYIFLSIALMQVTMIGLFGLKSKPGASLATVPLLVLNILFNEYCKARFLPTFRHRPVQVRRFLLNLLNMTSQIVITNLAISLAYVRIFIRLPMSLMRLRVRLKATLTMQSALIGHHGCVRRTWNLVLWSL
jgi:hypothetical protein